MNGHIREESGPSFGAPWEPAVLSGCTASPLAPMLTRGVLGAPFVFFLSFVKYKGARTKHALNIYLLRSLPRRRFSGMAQGFHGDNCATVGVGTIDDAGQRLIDATQVQLRWIGG